jgi:hypothetical protein
MVYKVLGFSVWKLLRLILSLGLGLGIGLNLGLAG